MSLCLLSFIGGHFLRKWGSRFLQEVGLTTLIGMAGGLVMKLVHGEVYMKQIARHFSSFFLIVLLPPIILNGGYNISRVSLQTCAKLTFPPFLRAAAFVLEEHRLDLPVRSAGVGDRDRDDLAARVSRRRNRTRLCKSENRVKRDSFAFRAFP